LACPCVSDHVTYGVSMNLPLSRDVMEHMARKTGFGHWAETRYRGSFCRPIHTSAFGWRLDDAKNRAKD
jgi:hypothetical protein